VKSWDFDHAGFHSGSSAIPASRQTVPLVPGDTTLIPIVNNPDLVTLFASAAFVRVVLRFTRHPAPVIPTLGTTKHTLTRGNELVHVHVEYTLHSRRVVYSLGPKLLDGLFMACHADLLRWSIHWTPPDRAPIFIGNPP
jgi:hypothetical protein